MSPKRRQDDGKPRPEANCSDDKRRRRFSSLGNVVLEVMRMQKYQLYMEPVLEPLIRRVVKEEVELALRRYLTSIKRNSGKEIQSTESRSLQLQFLPRVSLPVFTGTRIEGEDCQTFKVALVDAATGEVVHSGPESSAKVEIVVLEGDFDSDEGGSWTLEEFKINIVREREGKKPLLTGETVSYLKDGIGLVGEVSFSDNSSWTRSRKFRLGARVLDNFDGIRVREAKTESFIVRDHRGELYKKHHPPSLLDEVWRLEKIGKDGAFHKRLSREKVNTVKDFLTLLFLDPTRLKNILGTGMSAKMWEVTIEHARTCVVEPRLYFYYPSASQRKIGVAFNIVGQVIRLFLDCQHTPADKFSEAEKVEAHHMVIDAFRHWGEVIPFDDEASLMTGSSRLLNNTVYSNSAMVDACDADKIITPQKIGGFDYQQPSACSPDIMPSLYSMGDINSLDDFAFHDIANMEMRYDTHLDFSSQVPNTLISETESISRAFCEDDHLQFFDADNALQTPSSSDLHSAVSDFLLARSAAFAQKRWTKVFSVLKWFSVRKLVAKKTNVHDMPRYC